MEDFPDLTECRYCGSEDIHVFHYEEQSKKGVRVIDDLRCRNCKALLYGRSKMVKV